VRSSPACVCVCVCMRVPVCWGIFKEAAPHYLVPWRVWLLWLLPAWADHHCGCAPPVPGKAHVPAHLHHHPAAEASRGPSPSQRATTSKAFHEKQPSILFVSVTPTCITICTSGGRRAITIPARSPNPCTRKEEACVRVRACACVRACMRAPG